MEKNSSLPPLARPLVRSYKAAQNAAEMFSTPGTRQRNRLNEMASAKSELHNPAFANMHSSISPAKIDQIFHWETYSSQMEPVIIAKKSRNFAS